MRNEANNFSKLRKIAKKLRKIAKNLTFKKSLSTFFYLIYLYKCYTGMTQNYVVFMFLDFAKNDEILNFFEICCCARLYIVDDGK